MERSYSEQDISELFKKQMDTEVAAWHAVNNEVESKFGAAR